MSALNNINLAHLILGRLMENYDKVEILEDSLGSYGRWTTNEKIVERIVRLLNLYPQLWQQIPNLIGKIPYKEIINLALKRGYDDLALVVWFRTSRQELRTPLMLVAVTYNRMKVVEVALGDDPSIEEVNMLLLQTLTKKVTDFYRYQDPDWQGRFSMIKYFIGRGANLNDPRLMVRAVVCPGEVVEYLYQHHVPISLLAYMTARRYGPLEVVKYLESIIDLPENFEARYQLYSNGEREGLDEILPKKTNKIGE